MIEWAICLTISAVIVREIDFRRKFRLVKPDVIEYLVEHKEATLCQAVYYVDNHMTRRDKFSAIRLFK